MWKLNTLTALSTALFAANAAFFGWWLAAAIYADPAERTAHAVLATISAGFTLKIGWGIAWLLRRLAP